LVPTVPIGGKAPPGGDQIVALTGFDDAPAFHEEDLIGPCDRFDAMRNDEGGTVA
jgi:hypothetical protein